MPASGPASTLEERAAALAFLQKLAAEVTEGTIDLPCFPDVVVRISMALAAPGTNAEDVVTIVGAAPRLAARILQTANSAAFNTSGKPLTDLRSAITRLGHQMVHGTALSYAMQQMQNEASLRSIAQPLTLHGIGNLHIIARAATQGAGLGADDDWLDLLVGWQASIGKAVLESWGFAEEMCEAVGEQDDRERRWKQAAALADVLIASLILAEALNAPEPRAVVTDGTSVFLTVDLTPLDSGAILAEAQQQISLVHQALAA